MKGLMYLGGVFFFFSKKNTESQTIEVKKPKPVIIKKKVLIIFLPLVGATVSDIFIGGFFQRLVKI